MRDYEKMWEGEAGVMRNAMTTRAPGGAKNDICKEHQTAYFHDMTRYTVVL